MTGEAALMDYQARIPRSVLPIFLQIGNHFEPVGSCFVVVAAGNQAIALSARHVFDYAVRLDNPPDRHDAFIPPDLRPVAPASVKLRRTRLRAVYSEERHKYHLLDIQQVTIGTSNDLAVCHLAFADEQPQAHFTERLRLRSEPVVLSGRAALVGYSALAQHSVEFDGEDGSRLSLPMDLQLTAGQCVARNGSGSYLSPGPSFVVDQSAVHGMSGGPVLWGNPGEEAVACGVISHGSSDRPETTCAELWPLYALAVPWIEQEPGVQGSLLDFVRRGIVSDVSNPGQHVVLTPAGFNATEIRWT